MLIIQVDNEDRILQLNNFMCKLFLGRLLFSPHKACKQHQQLCWGTECRQREHQGLNAMPDQVQAKGAHGLDHMLRRKHFHGVP